MALVRIYQKPTGTPANSSVFAVEIQQNNIWYTKKVSWEDIKGLIAGATSLVFNNSTVTFTTPDGVAHEVLSVDDEVLAASGNPVTGGAVSTALAGKQDTLTFDQVPTDGSTNPVESNGIYDALTGKQDTLTFDTTPTDGSTNPVTSSGIYTAISAITTGIDWKEAVPTYADIATTYPNPQDGWTVTTLDDDHTYRYTGTEWVDMFSLITLATTQKDGLMSSSDFSKLAGIEAQANKTVVDSAFSASSTNPLQNKVVTNKFDTLLDVTETEDTTPYVYRQTPSGQYTVKEQLIGGSVVWNQLVQDTDTSVTVPSGHKYIMWNGTALSLATSDGTAITVVGGTDKIYDIMQKFGTSVANQMTTTKFASLFPNYANYAYSAPTIQSTKVSGKKVVGKNFVEDVINDASVNPAGVVYRGTDTTTYKLNLARIKAGLTYTISTVDTYDGFVGGYFETKPSIDSLAYSGRVLTSNKTFTAPIDGWVAFRSNLSCTTAQLELGSTATPYEPYHLTTYDLSGSHLVKRKYALVDLGTLTWNGSSGSYYVGGALLWGNTNDDIIAEKYIKGTSGEDTMIVANNNLIIRSTSTPTGWFLYKSVTPTTETVTNPTLYGIWKLDANNNLYFDGDTVDDIPNPQIVENGGTEEFIDAEVEAGNRDVSMPVGGGHKYGNNEYMGQIVAYMTT